MKTVEAALTTMHKNEVEKSAKKRAQKDKLRRQSHFQEGDCALIGDVFLPRVKKRLRYPRV